jgi:hypothetical protein
MWMRLYTVCRAMLRTLDLVLWMVLVGDRSSEVSKIPEARKHGVRRLVMAKVIEFYVPKNFQSSQKRAQQLQLGKVIEFRSEAKKSA